MTRLATRDVNKDKATPIQQEAPIHFGLANVTFDKTELSQVDGKQGALFYRGFSIEALAQKPSFEKTAYLLLVGEWPNEEQALAFQRRWANMRALPQEVLSLLESMKLATPTVALRTAISMLGTNSTTLSDSSVNASASIRFSPKVNQHTDDRSTNEQPILEQMLHILAQIPSVVVAHHAIRTGQPVPEPDMSLDHATDFIRRLLNRPISPSEAYLINLDAVLHADHGANASAFTARVITSTGADIYSALCGAVGAFSGPLHGGAIEGALAMLDEIGSPERAADYVAQRTRANQPIMGFGHRVYRGNDPRVPIYQQATARLANELDDTDLLEVLEAVIQAMAPHRRFGVGPNPDLHPAVIYRLLGLPDDLATPIFCMARSVGWCAQILEQLKSNILIRPRLRYVGPANRSLPVH